MLAQVVDWAAGRARGGGTGMAYADVKAVALQRREKREPAVTLCYVQAVSGQVGWQQVCNASCLCAVHPLRRTGIHTRLELTIPRQLQ